MKSKSILLILAYFLYFSNCAEILCIFVVPVHSHLSVYNAVTMELLSRGHKITLISVDPRENERNHVNVTLIELLSLKETYESQVQHFLLKPSRFFDHNPFLEILSSVFKNKHFLNLLKNDKKFDLLLMESFGFSPFNALAEYFNVPTVSITAGDALSTEHENRGNVINPVAHPDRLLEFPFAKTFSERLQSSIYWLTFKYVVMPLLIVKCDEITEKYFPNNKVKKYYDLTSNVDLLLINAHPVMGFIRPILPNTIPLGFLHIYPPQPLPGILQEILDKNTNGVIFVSFGTVYKPNYFPNVVQKLLTACENLPYLFLFKYDGVLDNVPKNMIIQKWFPQSDLLAHGNIKLFITQGGQQSMEESILRRVPMLIMLISSDQRANAIRVEDRQIAKVLDIHKNDKINSDDIKNSILDLVNNKRYKTNIENLTKLVEDVPMTSRDKAVWWIEYVIRNRGAKHFHYEQKNIPFYQYHYYDVIAFIGAVIVLIILIFMVILRLIGRFFEMLRNFKIKRD
ncbi:unnamed protein product [Chironomus riparius]|uniref:UDP-glucuronosyltransferase n=1 Tax=Chironomus riparius TaxID=315576 RepID=A0A9N9S2Q4_9DIPT|nr:unnamed protein product [Chironomus riparius]